MSSDERSPAPDSQTPLARAAQDAHISIADIATVAGVTYEAARRWTNEGARPLPRYQRAIERLLNIPTGSLWGDQPLPTRNAVVVDRLSSVSQNLLSQWIADTTNDLWIIAGSSLWIAEQVRDLGPLIRAQNVRNKLLGKRPMNVRICGADPASQATADRDASESSAPGSTLQPRELTARVAMALRQWTEILSDDESGRLIDGCQIKVFDSCWTSVWYRFDDRLLMYPYLEGARGIDTPVVVLHEADANEAFAAWLLNMEAVWAAALPYSPTTS